MTLARPNSMFQYPHHYDELLPQLEGFREFLDMRHAVLRDTTNGYEVLRFETARGTNVIYRKEGGWLTWPPDAIAAWVAFQEPSTPWSGSSGKRPKSHQFIDKLLKRDGDACFFCGLPLGTDITSEHLVPVCKGGPNNMANLFLAHEQCNKEAGHLSAVEKIKMRDKKRNLTWSAPPAIIR